MSWSASFLKPVKKAEAESAVLFLSTGQQTDPAAIDQCELAKAAVRALLPGIPGPFIHVSMSGHANGVGWQKKEGWSNDCVSISITQVTEPPL